MHKVDIRDDIRERVIARRGRFHLFDTIEPKRTAFVVIDMQNTFCSPGAPVEVPSSRGIVPHINRLARALRQRGGDVVWITSEATMRRGRSDWENFFNTFVAEEVRERTILSLAPGSEGVQLWLELDADRDQDLFIVKNRYSALASSSSQLERVFRSRGTEYVLIGGTKTNVCCETTARNAFDLDFKVVMVSDCNAALSDREHLATLETVIQQFGDVLTADEVIARMDAALPARVSVDA